MPEAAAGEMGKEKLHGSSLVQAMDTNKQDLPTPVCHRQSHSTGCSQSWAKESPFPGLTLLLLHQHWERKMWRAPGKSTRHEADCFRSQHFLWLQDYRYCCSMDNFPLPPGWGWAGTLHTACTDPPCSSRGSRGALTDIPTFKLSYCLLLQWQHIKYAGGCQPSSACPARGSWRSPRPGLETAPWEAVACQPQKSQPGFLIIQLHKHSHKEAHNLQVFQPFFFHVYL